MLALLTTQDDFGKVDIAEGFKTLRKFVEKARSDVGSLFDWSWMERSSIEVVRRHDIVTIYWTGSSQIRFRPQTGDMLSITPLVPDTSQSHKLALDDSDPGLSEAQCLEKVKEYLLIVTPVKDWKVFHTREGRELMSEGKYLKEIEFQGVPVVGPWPLQSQYGFTARIERSKGLLLHMRIPHVPDLSEANADVLSLEQLEQCAMAAYEAGTPYEKGKKWSSGIVLEVPTYGDKAKLAIEYQKLIEGFKAIPIFTLWMVEDKGEGNTDTPRHAQTIYVDARNGMVIAIERT